MARVRTDIEQRLQAAEGTIGLLNTVPGLSRRAAHSLVAELGTDLSRLPSAKQLARGPAGVPVTRKAAASG